MLISFSVTNYRSIKDTATLSFLPVKAFKELPGNVFKATDKINLLRSAVIYGANASGKSNVLKALENLIEYISNSNKLNVDEEILLYDPFKLDEESNVRPSMFSIEYLDADKKRYNYTIEINRNEVLKEKLISFPKGQSSKIFVRERNKEIEYGTTIKGEKKSIEARLLKNQLFFSKAANENISVLQINYLHIITLFHFQTTLGTLLKVPQATEVMARLFQELSESTKNNINKLVSEFDTGIQKIEIVENSFEKGLLNETDSKKVFSKSFSKLWKNEFAFDLRSYHHKFNKKGEKVESTFFSFKDESDGTRTLFSIAMFLLTSIEHGTVFIIDEIEQNLHPLLVASLINLFNNPEINTKNAQLLCTTHNTYLLSEDIFRRDQIWFTEKNERGETTLYSLADIEGVRNNIPYDKWYLSGRFGATPIVQEPDFLYKKNVPKKK